MKRKNLLTFILASFFILMTLQGAHTYASISGGEVCGNTSECKIDDLKKISQGIFSLIISVGLPLLVVFIIYRFIMAWYALQQGNANAYKEAGKKATEAIIGFIIIVALFGGIFLAMLKYFGASDWTTTLLQKISITEVIPHAYAQTPPAAPTTSCGFSGLPNPLGFCSLYDFILGALNVVMKFFLYPALIGIWVWSGFSYVLAQGAPEKLSKAHKLLLWAVISTLVVFMTQGFLNALRGSVNKILPTTTTTTNTITTTTTTTDNYRNPGEVGSVCTMPDGSTIGQLGTDLTCQGGRGSTTIPACNTFTTEPACKDNYSPATHLSCKWSMGCSD